MKQHRHEHWIFYYYRQKFVEGNEKGEGLEMFCDRLGLPSSITARPNLIPYPAPKCIIRGLHLLYLPHPVFEFSA